MENELKFRYTIIVDCSNQKELPCKVIFQIMHIDDDVEVLSFAYNRYQDQQPDISKYEIKKTNILEMNPFHFTLAARAIAYSEEFN